MKKVVLKADIFSEISSRARRLILFYLNEENLRISQLSKKLDMSIQATEKHVKNLLNTGLIRKNDGLLELTEVGKATINQIQSIEFLDKNKQFFKKHSLSYLPDKFVERIGELRNFEKVEGYVNTIEKYKKFLKETKKFAKIVIAQISLDIYKEGFPKFKKNNVDVLYILGENAIVPKGWLKLAREMKEQDQVLKGKLERKMIGEAHIMLYVSENAAFLALPDEDGVVDTSVMLASKDKKFCEWCLDLFDYLWKKSRVFLESKVHET